MGYKQTLFFIVAGFFYAGVCCHAEVREWVSRDGKTATAEFVDLEGDTLVLQRGDKALRVPLGGFCDEDQAYAKKQLVLRAQEEKRLAEERQKKAAKLIGFRQKVSVAARRWNDWESYYLESSCGEKVMEFFEKERSIVDMPEKGIFVSAKDAVRPPDYQPMMNVYCPDDYTGEQAYGVYIYIPPGQKAFVPSEEYQRMFDKYHLIFASPFGAGNKESDMRRCALTLDVLAQLRKDYAVDEDRIYVGGTSGGGAESMIAAFLYPADFRAALNAVRTFSLTSSSCLPFADERDIRKVKKFEQPYAFISGENDMNYSGMPASKQNFKDHGYEVEFFDIPGMKHQFASPATFDMVMQWVEKKNPRLK